MMPEILRLDQPKLVAKTVRSKEIVPSNSLGSGSPLSRAVWPGKLEPVERVDPTPKYVTVAHFLASRVQNLRKITA